MNASQREHHRGSSRPWLSIMRSSGSAHRSRTSATSSALRPPAAGPEGAPAAPPAAPPPPPLLSTMRVYSDCRPLTCETNKWLVWEGAQLLRDVRMCSCCNLHGVPRPATSPHATHAHALPRHAAGRPARHACPHPAAPRHDPPGPPRPGPVRACLSSAASDTDWRSRSPSTRPSLRMKNLRADARIGSQGGRRSARCLHPCIEALVGQRAMKELPCTFRPAPAPASHEAQAGGGEGARQQRARLLLAACGCRGHRGGGMVSREGRRPPAWAPAWHARRRPLRRTPSCSSSAAGGRQRQRRWRAAAWRQHGSEERTQMAAQAGPGRLASSPGSPAPASLWWSSTAGRHHRRGRPAAAPARRPACGRWWPRPAHGVGPGGLGMGNSRCGTAACSAGAGSQPGARAQRSAMSAALATLRQPTVPPHAAASPAGRSGRAAQPSVDAAAATHLGVRGAGKLDGGLVERLGAQQQDADRPLQPHDDEQGKREAQHGAAPAEGTCCAGGTGAAAA